jgi:hypothetical protein
MRQEDHKFKASLSKNRERMRRRRRSREGGKERKKEEKYGNMVKLFPNMQKTLSYRSNEFSKS